MPYLLLSDGTRLAYDDHGRGSPPLVFVHGGAGDRTIWAPQIDSLSGDHRCIAVDLRGYGESDGIPPYSPAQQAEDLAALLDSLVIELAVVVGHSLGGLAALLLNHHRPDLVGAVVVIDTPLMPGGVDPRALAAMLRSAGSCEPLVERFFGAVPGSTSALAVAAIRRSDVDVVASHLEASVLDGRMLRSLLEAAGTKPFLAIWPTGPQGEGPRAADPAWLADVVREAQQERLVGRHFIHLEQPGATNVRLREIASRIVG